MNEDPYDGREQTRAKHELLRRYLDRLAYKVLQTQGSLDYVDGFAGPWEERDTEFRDTSFGIAVEGLNNVVTSLYARKLVKTRLSVGCVFNEANPTAYRRLEAYAAEARERYGRLSTIETFRGPLTDNVEQIDVAARNRFRFLFVDPLGWTGFTPVVLTRLTRAPSELLINFMSSTMERHLRNERPHRHAWLAGLVGEDRAATCRNETVSIDRVRGLFLDMMREDLGFTYACASPVMKYTRRETHYWLLYGTRRPEGVEALRSAEVEALGNYEKSREGVRSGNQGVLADVFAPTGLYSRKRADDLVQLEKDISKLIQARPGLPFDAFAAELQQTRFVRQTEVKAAISKGAKDGLIDPTWRYRNPKARKPSGKDPILPRL